MSFRIEHRVGIAAPSDVIWELIGDIEGWRRWNPLYPEAAGRLAIGETLKLTEALPGRPPRQVAPVIVDWEPRAQILWRETGVLARTVRYLELETLTESGCIFANGAYFHGVLGQAQAKSQRRQIHQGYEALGETLKRLAEQGWRERSGAA